MGLTLEHASRNRRPSILKRLEKRTQRNEKITLKKVRFSHPHAVKSPATRGKTAWELGRAREEKGTGNALHGHYNTKLASQGRQHQVLSALRNSEEWQLASDAERGSMEQIAVDRLIGRRYEQQKLGFEVKDQRAIDLIDEFEREKQTLDMDGPGENDVEDWLHGVYGDDFFEDGPSGNVVDDWLKGVQEDDHVEDGHVEDGHVEDGHVEDVDPLWYAEEIALGHDDGLWFESTSEWEGFYEQGESTSAWIGWDEWGESTSAWIGWDECG